jgi:hypothetical protein
VPGVLRRGTRLGKYRLERQLGKGAFSEVFAARDTVEGRRVALKIAFGWVVREFGRDALADHTLPELHLAVREPRRVEKRWAQRPLFFDRQPLTAGFLIARKLRVQRRQSSRGIVDGVANEQRVGARKVVIDSQLSRSLIRGLVDREREPREPAFQFRPVRHGKQLEVGADDRIDRPELPRPRRRTRDRRQPRQP